MTGVQTCALPICKRIIDEIIVPRFKQGDFAGGIDAGIERMIKVVDGEPLPPPAIGKSTSSSFDDNMGWAVMLLVIFSGLLRWMFGALLGGVIVGAAAAMLAVWMGATWLIAGGVGIAAFFVTLMGVMNLGNLIGSVGGGSGNWGGGGGGFGGGGASGRW